MRFLLQVWMVACAGCCIDIEVLKSYHSLGVGAAMSEDPTRRMPDQLSFEERVLSELAEIRAEQSATRGDIAMLDRRLTAVENRLASVENRLTSMDNRLTNVENRLATLEDKVDARLRETRPIWENVQSRLITIEGKLEDIHLQFVEVVKDSYAMPGRIGRLEEHQRTPVP